MTLAPLASFLLWSLALSAAGSIVPLAADRAVRRLRPLTALLRLTIIVG